MNTKNNIIFGLVLLLLVCGINSIYSQNQSLTPKIKIKKLYHFDNLEAFNNRDSITLKKRIRAEYHYNDEDRVSKSILYPTEKYDYLEKSIQTQYFKYNGDTTFIAADAGIGNPISEKRSILNPDSSTTVYIKAFGEISDYQVYQKLDKIKFQEMVFDKHSQRMSFIEIIPSGEKKDTIFRNPSLGNEDVSIEVFPKELNAINYSLLKTKGSIEIFENDTVRLEFHTTMKLDSMTTLKEIVNLYKNGGGSKFEFYYENDKTFKRISYQYSNKEWRKTSITEIFYNHYQLETHRIRYVIREDKIIPSSVRLFEYEYYN